MKLFFGFYIGIIFFSFNCVTYAKDVGNMVASVELQKKITDINRIKPLQNPRHEKSVDILNRHILDSKNKVIGEVDDILINNDGRVSSILVNFDRLHLGQSVFLNYDVLDIGSVTSGYRLGFNSDEVETLYPALLSGIETASGSAEGDSGKSFYSIKDLLGSSIVTSDGIIIGKLQDVLFDQDGTYVRSIYLSINYQTLHNKGVAVPLSILSFEDHEGKTRAVIDKRYVDIILQYAKEG